MSISPVSGLQAATIIVSPTAGLGNYTTIAAAITAAASGTTILIKPGSYVENLTLKAGVDLTAWPGDQADGNVTISGTCTLTVATTVNISSIRLQTNSAALLAVTGSAASIINLNNCYLNCTNNTGITFSSSNAAASIFLNSCTGDLGTTGIGLFAHSSAGTLQITLSRFTNSGGSSTASTASAGSLLTYYSHFFSPITTSGTNLRNSLECKIDTSAQNATSLTVSTGAGSSSSHDVYSSGSASAISIGGTDAISEASVNSTNTNAITGAGTVSLGTIDFINSNVVNTTTRAVAVGTRFSQTVSQVFTSTGTYTPTSGMKYCIVEVVGGGGGGGGSIATTNAYSSAGGGGAGGYSRKVISAATIGTSQAVTIGAAGTAGSAGNNAGGAGGTTSLGSLISATGGAGGAGGASQTITPTGALGGAGGVGSSGDFNANGAPGGTGIGNYAVGVLEFVLGGIGGSSLYGGGGVAVAPAAGAGSAGNAGTVYGSGGSGGVTNNSNSSVAGGAGAAGIVIVTEYI